MRWEEIVHSPGPESHIKVEAKLGCGSDVPGHEAGRWDGAGWRPPCRRVWAPFLGRKLSETWEGAERT